MTIATNRYLQELKARDRAPRSPLPTKAERAPQPPDSFAVVLRSLRERATVSQNKLAERAEMDHSYISRLESGARMPARDAVDRIAAALNLTADDRDKLLHAANFRTGSARPMLSCPALAALDEAHRSGSIERRAWIERWIALALEAA